MDTRADHTSPNNMGVSREKQYENGDALKSSTMPTQAYSEAQDCFLEFSESSRITRSTNNFEGDVQSPLLETSEVSKPRPEIDPAETQPEAETSDDHGVPYDSGWAWIVVLGQSVNAALISGFLRSTSLFFVELLRHFNASASHTALLFGIISSVFSISSFYVMNVLLSRFGSRRLTMVGGVLMSLSAILSSLATDITLLILLYSVLFGMGMAMLPLPGTVLVGTYFKKRRSLAMAFTKCGASVGKVAAPPLITFLLSKYGLTGTLLLYGAICLHSVPAAMLFRPISFYTKQHRHRPYHHQPSGRSAKKQNFVKMEPLESDLTGCGDGGTVLHTGATKQEVTDETSEMTAAVIYRDSERVLQTKKKVTEETSAATNSANPKSFVTEQTDVDHHLQDLSSSSMAVITTTQSTGDPNLPSVDVEISASGFSQSNSGRTSVKVSDTSKDEVHVVSADSRSELRVRSATNTQHHALSEPLVNTPQTHKHAQSGSVDKHSSQYSIVNAVSSADLTFASGVTTTSPGVSITRPEVITTRPGVTTTRPGVTTTRPEVTTTRPGVTTTRPEVTTIRPEVTTTRPEVTTTRPEVTTNQNLKGTIESFRSTDELRDHRPNKEKHGRACSCRRELRNVTHFLQNCVLMLDFSLLRSSAFRILLLFAIVAPLVNASERYFPAAVMQKGLPESQVAVLLSISGALDFVCSLSSGFIADLKVLRVAIIMAIAFVILGITVQFVRFMTSFEHFVVLAVLQGLFGGTYSCLLPVLVIDFVGLKDMGKALGFMSLTTGAFMAAVHPFLGYIRDLTGSYAIVYHVIGCGILLAATILCLERPVRRLGERKDRENHGPDV